MRPFALLPLALASLLAACDLIRSECGAVVERSATLSVADGDSARYDLDALFTGIGAAPLTYRVASGAGEVQGERGQRLVVTDVGAVVVEALSACGVVGRGSLVVRSAPADYFPLRVGLRLEYTTRRQSTSPVSPTVDQPGTEVWEVVADEGVSNGERRYELSVVGTGSGYTGRLDAVVRGDSVRLECGGCAYRTVRFRRFFPSDQTDDVAYDFTSGSPFGVKYTTRRDGGLVSFYQGRHIGVGSDVIFRATRVGAPPPPGGPGTLGQNATATWRR